MVIQREIASATWASVELPCAAALEANEHTSAAVRSEGFFIWNTIRGSDVDVE
jgi:hypothetical protein